MNVKYLSNLKLPFKIAVSVTILAALYFQLAAQDTDLLDSIGRSFQASAWVYSIIFMLLQYLLLAVRWRMLINIGQKHLSLAKALEIHLTSQLANLVFFTSLGGLLARAAMSAQHGVGILKTFIATVFDRLFTLFALLLLSAMFLPNLSTYVENKTAVTLAAAMTFLMLTGFLLAPMIAGKIASTLPKSIRQKKRFRYGLRYFRALGNNPSLLAKLIALSVIGQTMLFLSVYVIVHSTGAGITFWQMMIVIPITSLVAAMPISVGGWGVREGAYVIGFGLLGVPMETAFLVSVQMGLINMIVILLSGMPYLLTSLRARKADVLAAARGP
jgi:uncharacterized protein (TIRG00374 family)